MRPFIYNRRIMLLILAASSALLYAADFILLGDFKELTIWFLGNLAFLPLYVIFVTMILERVLRERERQAVLRKLNMVIGVFFSEVGNRLLRELSSCINGGEDLKLHLLVRANWKEQEYQVALRFLDTTDITVDSAACDKAVVEEFLLSKRNFLVGLLENQNLLEHEAFTDLLWAVFHLSEELEARPNYEGLPKSDIDHLNGDIKRVFDSLSRQWLLYMQHLQTDYPYLFSLAIRMNPMVENPDPKVY